jgi:hypothetical protein
MIKQKHISQYLAIEISGKSIVLAQENHPTQQSTTPSFFQIRIADCSKEIYAMCLVFFLSGCAEQSNSAQAFADQNFDQYRSEFTCIHQEKKLPAIAPEIDQLFQYARFLEKRREPIDLKEIGRMYRIAAAHGHYKANSNLQILIQESAVQSYSPYNEMVTLANQLIKAGIPRGFGDMGYYLFQGYGVKQDIDLAQKFTRKAADLGNPDAQFKMAEYLSPDGLVSPLALQMIRCAAEQGHGKALYKIALNSFQEERYEEVLQVFQRAAVAGDADSAYTLANIFENLEGQHFFKPVNTLQDPERVRRYRAIGAVITGNVGRNPRFPDIDKIVPLPPAKLPEWDNRFQWQIEYEAALAPPKPSEAVLKHLSDAKKLDPANGFPITPPEKIVLRGSRERTTPSFSISPREEQRKLADDLTRFNRVAARGQRYDVPPNEELLAAFKDKSFVCKHAAKTTPVDNEKAEQAFKKFVEFYLRGTRIKDFWMDENNRRDREALITAAVKAGSWKAAYVDSVWAMHANRDKDVQMAALKRLWKLVERNIPIAVGKYASFLVYQPQDLYLALAEAVSQGDSNAMLAVNGEILYRVEQLLPVGKAMTQCAFEQGNPESYSALGLIAEREGRLVDAYRLWEKGVNNGCSSCIEYMQEFARIRPDYVMEKAMIDYFPELKEIRDFYSANFLSAITNLDDLYLPLPSDLKFHVTDADIVKLLRNDN